MKTKDLVLVGVGVALGYLVVAYMKKNKTTAPSSDSTEPTAEQLKLDACTKKAEESMAYVKFANMEDAEKHKQGIIDACMSEQA